MLEAGEARFILQGIWDEENSRASTKLNNRYLHRVCYGSDHRPYGCQFERASMSGREIARLLIGPILLFGTVVVVAIIATYCG